MPNLNQPYRWEVDAAIRQLELEAELREATAQREALRWLYPPKRYVRTPRFVVWFCWLGGAVAIGVWLCKLNHWFVR